MEPDNRVTQMLWVGPYEVAVTFPEGTDGMNAVVTYMDLEVKDGTSTVSVLYNAPEAK